MNFKIQLFHIKFKLKIRQMGMGSGRWLSTKHERLWADEVIELQYRLLVMNEIRAFQETDPRTVVTLHSTRVHLLLTEQELDDIPTRGSSDCAPFAPGPNVDVSEEF